MNPSAAYHSPDSLAIPRVCVPTAFPTFIAPPHVLLSRGRRPLLARRRRPRTSERGLSLCASAPVSRSSGAQDASPGAPSAEDVPAAGVPVTGTQYVPLHVHSDFSLLDGASHLPDLVARAAELGVPALALTDHGVLYGAVGLLKYCAASSTPVKPIIGNEMYVANVDTPYTLGDDDAVEPLALDMNTGTDSASGDGKNKADSLPTGQKKGKRKSGPRKYHLIVLAKNTTGYRNLVKLTTHAHLHGKVGTGIFARPCTNKAMLYDHREGLIVSSGCLGGEVAQAILNDRPDVARDVARWYSDVFGSDYYLEIQDHGSPEDRKVNVEVVKIGKELGISVIVTNDSHFTSCLDAEAHDALICIQTGKLLTDENRLRYAGNEFFKSADEMRLCFVDHLRPEDVERALRCTLEVAQKVEAYDLFGETRIPDFPIPVIPKELATTPPPYKDDDHSSYLRYVTRLGLAERLRTRRASGLLQPAGPPGEESNEAFEQRYSDRLEFELDMLEEMGFASYFLVVWDYIRYARSEGIPVGPGRGSAAGSLVAFALRITDVDPIEYNLLFERFLNPERRSMPDIDTDFSVEGREKIIRYVTAKYGTDRVAQIITFNRLTSKAVLKDVARVHSVPYSEADKLAKLIPVSRGKPATLSEMMGEKSPSKEFKQIVKRKPGYVSWLEKARRIEGTNKTFGIHAAGVVISAEPLTDFVPLSRAKHGETITQYPMEDVEALGLLKMDFLGLKNLSVIETAVSFIAVLRRKRFSLEPKYQPRTVASDRSECGPDFELDFSVDTLPLDDAKTYEFLSSGELDGIFQLDASGGMRSIVRELRPSSLEDISSILALYRPGPLDAGLIPKFINRKHGKEEIVYDHELLEPILKETYGIMVYQEQIMRIARDLAGYSLGQADILRRAMGKKKKADMAREQPRFVAGAVERGVDSAVAANLFEMMTLFAEYCFNKSHSTAYAYLTYQTAYLKANYPVEYAAALLRANSNQSDKLVRYLADANVSGVQILPPSVNRSDLEFSVDVVEREDVLAGVTSERYRNVVLFGLAAVKTVGESVGRALIDEREARGPFKSIIDVIERLDSRVLNKRSMGALVMCGAFDELHPNRKVLHEQLEILLSLHRKVRDRRKRREKKTMSADQEQAAIERDAADWEAVQMDLKEKSKSCPDFDTLDKLAAEKATLGFYASGHPLREIDRDCKHMLTSASVSAIVGEISQAPSGEENDLTGHATMDNRTQLALGDGSEIMCLSLVTDLKRMTTSRGRKMAKWFMEDTSARVPAIVFPANFALCEALVGAGMSDQSLESETKAEETGNLIQPSFVIEEDARVVVWGKVDRESSGSSQVIVDDVQRVEEVKVLLATVVVEDESIVLEGHISSEESKISFVRYSARSVIDPASIYEVQESGSYSFINKDGREMTARRSKKLVLEEKARIPLVIKLVNTRGYTQRHIYAGHMHRFRSISKNQLDLLAEKTGSEFELVDVRDILNGTVSSRRSGMDVSTGRRRSAADEADGSESHDVEFPVGIVTTPSKANYELPVEITPNHRQSTESILRPREEDAFVSDQSPESDDGGRVSDDGISDEVPSRTSGLISLDTAHVVSGETGHLETESAGQTDSVQISLSPSEKPESETQDANSSLDSPNSFGADSQRRPGRRTEERGLLENMVCSERSEEVTSVESVPTDTSETAPESSLLLRKLQARRASVLKRPRLRADSADEHSSPNESLRVATVAGEKEAASRTPVVSANVDRGFSRNENYSLGVKFEGSLALISEREAHRSELYGSELQGGKRNETGNVSNALHPVDMAERKEETRASDGSLSECDDSFLKASAGDVSTSEDPPPSTHSCREASVDCGNGVKDDTLEGNSELPDLTAGARTSKVNNVNPKANTLRWINAPHCGVEMDDVPVGNVICLGALLDAVCFTASDVSRRFTGHLCYPESVRGMDLSKAAHGTGFVDLKGCVAFTDDTMVHVFLHVRESSPTAGRKRARTLTSAVVSCRKMDGGSLETSFQSSTAQAKKNEAAAKSILTEPNIKTTTKELCFDVGASEGSNMIRVFRLDDTLGGADPVTFADGGNLLLWCGNAGQRALDETTAAGAMNRVISSLAECTLHDLSSLTVDLLSGMEVHVDMSGLDHEEKLITVWAHAQAGGPSPDTESRGRTCVFAHVTFGVTQTGRAST